MITDLWQLRDQKGLQTVNQMQAFFYEYVCL